MKHNKNIIEEVVKLKLQNIKSREIARRLGISKTSVNDNFNKYLNSISIEIDPSGREVVTTIVDRKPKICIIDVETSAAKVYCFGRFNQNFGEDNIYEEGGLILCACWRWIGEDEIYSIWMTPEQLALRDDSDVAKELFKVYQEADAVVMHNAKKFDHKVIQTRVLYWRLKELPVVKVIDTLQIAKSKLRLPSNKLDSIGEYFGLGRKIKTEGIRLWAEVQEGNPEAMKRMVTYCQQDVNLLYNVYMLLRGLGSANSGFNAAQYYEDTAYRCRECGSLDLKLTGKHYYTQKGRYEELECYDCGASIRTSDNLLSKAKKETLLL